MIDPLTQTPVSEGFAYHAWRRLIWARMEMMRKRNERIPDSWTCVECIRLTWEKLCGRS